MKVTIIGRTVFLEERASDLTGGVWSGEGTGAQDLSEYAGRNCYQSWRRPNPATATNEGYLKHILEVEHESVLEHGSVTVDIRGVSRSLTHELVRHRHHSPSQLSQRFVLTRSKLKDKYVPGEDYIVPPLFAEDGIAIEMLERAWISAVQAYEDLVERAFQLIATREEQPEATARLKMAREAARAVLPNMTPTAIVLTGNHRAWRDAIAKRATLHADAEICALFVEIFKQLRDLEPNIYQDMHVCNTGEREWVCGCFPDSDGKATVWHGGGMR